MPDGTLDPMDSFVARFRMLCGGDHVIVGPPGGCADDPKASIDRQVIQVVGPARCQTQGLAVSNWYFDAPDISRANGASRYLFTRDMQAMLAGC